MQDVLALIHELVKFIGLLYIGQGLVYVLSFGRHETNPVYKAFRFLTSPVTRAVRAITPRVVVDRHIPLAAFFLLFWAWAILIFVRLEMKQAGA